jgi:hypothetical protein
VAGAWSCGGGGNPVAKSIPSDYIEIVGQRVPRGQKVTGRSVRWIPEAMKILDQRSRLSCAATPSGVGIVRTMFVKSGWMRGFWSWPVTSFFHNLGSFAKYPVSRSLACPSGNRLSLRPWIHPGPFGFFLCLFSSKTYRETLSFRMKKILPSDSFRLVSARFVRRRS